MSELGLTYTNTNNYLLLETSATDTASTGGLDYNKLIAASDGYTAQRILANGTTIAITNTSTDYSTTETTMLVDAVGSDATKAYATVTETDATHYSLAANDNIADITAVNVTGIEAEFNGSDFYGKAITATNTSSSNTAVFQVTAADSDKFTVVSTATDAPNSVTGATALTLTGNGYIQAGQNQEISIDSTANKISVDSGDTTAYTVQRTSSNAATVTGIDATDTTVLISQLAGTNASTDDLVGVSDTTVTYTFGKNADQILAITGDASEGLTFTVNADGYVTTVANLDENAKLTVTDPTQALTVVNSQTFTASAAERTFMGTNATKTDAVILVNDPVYFEIGTSGVQWATAANDTIGTLAALSNAAIGTYTAGTSLQFGTTIVPTFKTPITVKGVAGSSILIKGNATDGKDYIAISGADTAVKIFAESENAPLQIKLVTISGSTISDATTIPTSGGIVLQAADDVIDLAGRTVTAGAASTTVNFTENGISLETSGVKVEEAVANDTFILAATSAATYTINDLVYTSAAANATDSVTINGDAEITLTTANKALTAANVLSVADGTTNTVAGTKVNLTATADQIATYKVGDNYYAVVNENGVIENGAATSGTFQLNKSDTNFDDLAVGTRTVTSTSDVVNVTVASGAITTVSDIDENETFTVKDDSTTTTYKMSSAGLFKLADGATDITNGAKLISGDGIVTDSTTNKTTFTIDTAYDEKNVILITSTQLDWSTAGGITANTVVLNSASFAQLADIAYDATTGLTFKNTAETGAITRLNSVPADTILKFEDYTATVRIDTAGAGCQ